MLRHAEKYCLGVRRELQNSPNRETDDVLILKAVLGRLASFGVNTRLMSPEEFDSEELKSWDIVLPMCETYFRLKRLERDRREGSSVFINAPDAVLNCYRTHMVPLLSGSAHLDFPPSELRSVCEGAGVPPVHFDAPEGWWIKRGDVHNTCDHDVVFIRKWSDLSRVLEDFEAREIAQFVVQPHIGGDMIKFYGVGPGRWFTWFYHSPAQAERLPFDPESLASAAASAAVAVGLEVFGGDAIVSAENKITIIDVNSWPSFARVRDEAAGQIADHVFNRLQATLAR